MHKRITSLCMVFILVLGLFPALTMQAEAGSPVSPYNFSSSYKSGKYYQKLMDLNMGSDPISNVVNVAKSQVGYRSHSNSSKLGGDGDGKGDYNEYCMLTLKKPNAQWCASFVSWCFRLAGVPTSVVPTTAGCGTLRKSVKTKGATWHSINSGYKPKAGDILLLEALKKASNGKYYYDPSARDSSGFPTLTSHVALVVSSYNEKTKTFGVIEGNGSKNTVSYNGSCKMYVAGPKLGGGTCNRFQGFVTPNYGAIKPTEPEGGGGGGGGVEPRPYHFLDRTSAYDKYYYEKDDTAGRVIRFIKQPGDVITDLGIILYPTSADPVVFHEKELSNLTKLTEFHIWYDIKQDFHHSLNPGSYYKYRFFARVGNDPLVYSYVGDIQTTGTSPDYTITFDPNGGSVTPCTIPAKNGSYIDLPTPEWPGHRFIGWYNQDGTYQYQSYNELFLSNGKTMYARWEELLPEDGMLRPGSGATEASVQFSEQPGEHGLCLSSGTVSHSVQITKSESDALTQIGYIILDADSREIARACNTDDVLFPGQTTASSEVGIQMPTLSLALAAGYGTLVPYAVVNDTEITGQPVPFYCEYEVEYQDTFDQRSLGSALVKNGNPFTLPVPPVHAGQRFLGWFTEDGQKITKESTANLTQNITLFGKYASDGDYAISGLTWDGGPEIPQGTFSAQIQISNAGAGGAQLIAAVYDAHGKLLSVNCGIIPASESSSTVSVQLSNPGTADYLRAFVVSAGGSSSPLCNSFSTK